MVNDCGAEQSRLTFFLDGAHTPESMVACGDWFADCVNADTISRKGNPMASSQAETQDDLNRRAAENTQRFLIFNCMQVVLSIYCRLLFVHQAATVVQCFLVTSGAGPNTSDGVTETNAGQTGNVH